MRDRLTRLSEASLRIIESIDFNAVIQEVIDGARSLTGARYGALLTYDDTGGIRDFITSGITPEQLKLMKTPPRGLGLLGYLNEIREPLRLDDIARHPSFVGFPEDHPPMKTFLGMPVRHRGEHFGNIYLTEKEGVREFTPADEETLVMFATQAASAISNARRYEEELKARANLRTLINISPVGVVVFDAKTGRVISSNREVFRIAGELGPSLVSLEEIWDKLYFRRADGREISLGELPTARVLQSGETVRAEEIVICMPDGRTVETLVNAAPIYSENEEIESVVVTVQDLTPLEDKERLRAEFLGLVSEELRVPLTTIKGSVASLQDTANFDDTTDALQLLRIIDHQADFMRVKINSLVELTHIEAGTLPVSPESSEVHVLVDDTSEEFSRSHPGNVIEKSIPADLPAVMVDKQRIGQVFRNLLYSAARYSSESSPIKVTAHQLDVHVVVSVSASGRGISFDDPSPFQLKLSRIGPHEMGRTTGGNDLALAISKGIVEAHGGRIQAQRGEDGYGITFTFTLPAILGEAGSPDTEPLHLDDSPKVSVSSVPGEKARILVAVEDPRTVGAVRRILSRAGYSSTATLDFGDLDDLIADGMPHLILLDLFTAGAEGFELVHRLSDLHGLPVIVLCGQGDEDNIGRAFDMGADDYIVKPFSPMELVARVDASLRKRSALRHNGAPKTYRAGNVAINYSDRTVVLAGTPIQLTATEYKLLMELSTRAGRVLTQDELLQRVWGPGYIGETQLLRSYVKTLRQKLGDHARNPTYIFTEHGIGYRMIKP